MMGMTEKDSIDCSRCCFFDCEQDTDDWGRYIAPPVLTCEKGHKLSIKKPNRICSEFEDAWKGDMND
jgi:hypothetical protein